MAAVSKTQVSHLQASPAIRMLDKEATRDITKEVKNVYEVEQKSNDWKNKAVDTLVIIAAAVAFAIIGAFALKAGVVVIGALALGLAGVAFIYGMYSTVTTITKKTAEDQILEVHADAIDYRFANAVDKKQQEAEAKKAEVNLADELRALKAVVNKQQNKSSRNVEMSNLVEVEED